MIAAEAIVAQVGVVPGRDEILTKEDGRAAVKLPKLWHAEIRAWFDQAKPRAFRLPPPHAFEKTLDLLSGDLPPGIFAQVQEPGVMAACKMVLDRSRAYARSVWPVRYLDRPTGQILLEPGDIELMGANSILAVLDDPDRFVEELRMETVEDDQIKAFKACFPDLHGMVVAQAWEEIDRKALDKTYSMPWSTELVFRRLIGMPPEMSISQASRPEPAAAAPTIKADFSSLKTKAQRLGER